MTTIVFSKDRAMQLDAFLRSYEAHVSTTDNVFVLYHASTGRHDWAYDEVFLRHRWATPRRGTAAFKRDFLGLLPSAGSVVFFVDDQVFIRPWTVIDKPGLSLRHGLHLTRNYNSNDAAQPLPPYRMDGEFVMWRWEDGQLAWAYPLSVDGHVFGASEMATLLGCLEFTSPNTLESAMQRYLPAFAYREGICYTETRVVNIPWNRVQDECPNRCADDRLTSADEMLRHWEMGCQIDLTPLMGILNESVHQEFPLLLEPRS